MNIVVGISWPFANGNLHIGHASSSLPGDVIARYHRLKGNQVLLVSGSDAHGTPIDVKAQKEGKTQKEIVDICDKAFRKDFKDLGISFDLYTRTDDLYHKKFVQEQFIKYQENGYLYEKQEKSLYCASCNLFLADRYVIGICPKCKGEVKGDECDTCGILSDIKDVEDKKCAICGSTAVYRETKNLYFAFSKFQSFLQELVNNHEGDWRENAVTFTRRYLKEGIPDRCASRSLKWGIDLPVEGYEDKKIYGWLENVWGYVSAVKRCTEENGFDFEDFWKKGRNNKIYLVHAKDNIPFHTVLFPALLEATHENYTLPDKIISNCHITIEGEKLSKSKGNYIEARYLLDRYPADSIRYYFLSNEAVHKDMNFSWENFINTHNGELLGKWGNLIHRTFVFIEKSFDGKIKKGTIDKKIEEKLIEAYERVGTAIDCGNIRDGLLSTFELISFSNKYFDEKEPWKQIKEDKDACEEILYNILNLIYNINTLLKPYLPFSSKKVEEYFQKNHINWRYEEIGNVSFQEPIIPLYERYPKQRIEEELSKMNRENKI